MGLDKFSFLIILVLVGAVAFCLFTTTRDRYSDIQPSEPAACRWLAEEMVEGGAEDQLVRNARDMCINYHGMCGSASGGAEVLSIYDNFGNNWEVATDILAQDMDAAGKDKANCISSLDCKKKEVKCPAFLTCVSGACQ